jgi:hypothetical protein
MEAVGNGKQKDRGRSHKWLAVDRALSQTKHLESQELLRLAEQRRTVE